MSSNAKRIRLETADTQETTIEKLCDDVLIEIFSFLSTEELKSATLVCKHWNEVIGSSAVAMEKFKLKLKESELIGRQFSSSRKYRNIELKLLVRGDQKSLENLVRLFELSQVERFKIFAYNQLADPKGAFVNRFNNPWRIFSIDAMKLTSALKQMKLLQELFIECPAGFRGSFTSTIDLSKLTKLVVKCPDASIFQGISAGNVTEIDLIYQAYGFEPVNVQHLASFLKLCKQITTLKLNSSMFHDLFGNGQWKDFNLRLPELHIKGYGYPTSLREFLMSQAPSLTSLRMKNVLTCFTRSEIASVIEAMSHLKNLKILSYDYAFRPNESFLRRLTELEQLTLSEVKDINSIARFNRKLTYLNIFEVENSLDPALEFSELKHLRIWVDPSLNYLKAIKGSPKLETIELRLTLAHSVEANSCDEVIKAAMRQPTVRHLKLEYPDHDCSIRHLKEIFDRITSDSGQLKSLSLSMNELKSVEFLFPENRSDWNADGQKMRLDKTFCYRIDT